MKIKYAGPRPQISHHGVSFKDGKEDKYVYLIIALQILQAIDKDYESHSSYSYDITTKRLTDDEMSDIMKSYEKDLEKLVSDEIAHYSIKLEDEIQEVDTNKILKQIEKEIFKKNLLLMKEYRIQRAINKIYYMHAISYIGNIIRREGLKEIDTPFYEKFWHVLQTIEGQFLDIKTPVSTKLVIENNKENQLEAKLYITGA